MKNCDYTSLMQKLNAIRSGQHVSRVYYDDCAAYIDAMHHCNNKGDFNKALEGGRKILDLIPGEEVFLRNKLLNEIELAENKVVLDSKARGLVVNVTPSCNLDCIMCEQHRNDLAPLPEKTIHEITALFPYLESILWQGGEPLLYEKMAELIKKAGSYPHIQQQISTNGMLLDEKWSELLVDNRVWVHFSIDSTEKDVYERIRKGASLERVLENLKYFVEYKNKNAPELISFLKIVVMKSNYTGMEKMIEFAHEMAFSHIIFISMNGRADKNENIFESKDTEALEYIKNSLPGLEKKAQTYGISFINSGISVCPETAVQGNSARDTPNNRLLCHLPWVSMYINYDGTVLPYCLCNWKKPVGNVFRSSLEELWNNDKMTAYRRSILSRTYSNTCKIVCVEGRMQESCLKFI